MFEKEALRYFKEEVPSGYTQRIDGIECFSKLSEFWFWRYRLHRMASRGLIKRSYHGSIWASCNGMVAYGSII